MGIKSVLCIFDGLPEELYTVNSTLKLANLFNAHAHFLHISHDAGSYNNVYEGNFVISPDLINKVEQENKDRLTKAELYITSLAAKHHLSINTQTQNGNHASSQFTHRTGNYDVIIGSEGIANDIIVMWNDIENKDVIRKYYTIAALFNTGRPVLFLPEKHANQAYWEGKTVSIAWDGSMGSARAIFYAMPLLERAKKVYLLTAGDNGKNSFDSQAPMARYLSIYGIKPDYIALNSQDNDAAKTILAKSKELESDLLVMGAYGHNRFRELILGGFTLYMLEHSDMPLLLAH